jgi:hypothetical protein
MNEEKSAGSRAAQAANLARKAIAIARAFATGGKVGAAAEAAKQFLPQALKLAAVILISSIFLCIAVFVAIPHFLFSWTGSALPSVLDFTNKANIISDTYGNYGSVRDDVVDSLIASVDKSGYSEVNIRRILNITTVEWVIAITAVRYVQDLERISPKIIADVVKDMLTINITKVAVSKKLPILNIVVRDIGPEALMLKYGFSAEQKEWARSLHDMMTIHLRSGIFTPSYYPDLEYGDVGSPMGDGSYAALITEAERHLGKPYHWGGFGPNSFDCSGFVSYVLIHSGVRNTGRLTAQGLFNISTPIPRSEAQPGDLIFFSGTYAASHPVTHVGIYVGDGRMIHAGNPIGYQSIETSYWKRHFYSFGRLN